MFHFHKCKHEKIQEIPVYNTKEVQDLYQKVYVASSSMDFKSGLSLGERKINKHTKTFSIKMEHNHFSLYLIPIIIDGKAYRFIVDTGAQISAILSKHKKLIEKYAAKNKIPVKSAGGNQKSLDTICLDKFFLGSLEIDKQSFVVLSADSFKLRLINKDIMDFDGIIGWDILSQIDFEMDTKKGLFSLIDTNEYYTYCNLVEALFPVVIVYDEARKPAIFGIDTGAKVSWINDAYALANHLKITRESSGLNFGVHGMERIKIKCIKECIVSFFESRITLSNLRSGETQVFVNLHLDGIFGNEIFKQKRIQFLNSKGIVRIIE